MKGKSDPGERLNPTLYPHVNEVLHGFGTQLRTILGDQFLGMYLTGSLALGDFDPRTSDIDFVVLTGSPLSSDLVEAIRDMHDRFSRGGSPWAGRIEAVYITPETLQSNSIPQASYPQVEKERPLFIAPLEVGWIFHLYTLREYGVTVTGPPLRPLIDPVDPDTIRRAAAPIAEEWLEQARHDPTWLEWLRERHNWSFVILTLCRLLYTLDQGSVTSKPAAARWAQQALDPRWSTLITQALTEEYNNGAASESEIKETIALLEYTVERFQRWKRSRPLV